MGIHNSRVKLITLIFEIFANFEEEEMIWIAMLTPAMQCDNSTTTNILYQRKMFPQSHQGIDLLGAKTRTVQ